MTLTTTADKRAVATARRLTAGWGGMPETSLYPAVKRFLQRAGFSVKGEVNGCGVVAIRDGEPQQLVIVEMKLGF